MASQGSFAALAQMEEDKKAEKKKKKEKKVEHQHTHREKDTGIGDRGFTVLTPNGSLTLVSSVFVLVRLQEKADKEKKEKKVSTQIQKSISPLLRTCRLM